MSGIVLREDFAVQANLYKHTGIWEKLTPEKVSKLSDSDKRYLANRFINYFLVCPEIKGLRPDLFNLFTKITTILDVFQTQLKEYPSRSWIADIKTARRQTLNAFFLRSDLDPDCYENLLSTIFDGRPSLHLNSVSPDLKNG